MMLAGNLLYNILGVVVGIVVIVLAFFKRRFNYWKNLGVVQREPTIPTGNSAEPFIQKISTGEWLAQFYSFFKTKNVIHGGIYFFHRPIYVPVDLDLIKQIMQVDFAHFTDHGVYVNERDDPLSAHVFSLEGQRWRNLRIKLTPTFTSGKMKNMFPIVVDVSKELINVLEQQVQEGKPVDAKNISARYTTDIIGNVALGINCNSLLNPDAEFRVQGQRLLQLTWSEMALNLLSFLYPDLMRALRVRLFPKEAADFFWKAIKEVSEHREQNNIRRNDALQLLLDMKNTDGKESENTLTFNEIAAQAFIFFVGGFETSSTLMSFALLELAANEDVQNTLRDEINMILMKNDGKFTYESLAEMKYLDMVINETLRKYPPLSSLSRKCTKDYRVPDTDVVLKKGISVIIPIRGIHYDPKYYPDPEKFQPTRFTEENKTKRHQFAFLPFGEGPRMCLGIRFGMMQTRIGLASVVKNFRIKKNSQTEIPVKLDPRSPLTAAAEALWVDLEKLD